jgi:hypothetical protein
MSMLNKLNVQIKSVLKKKIKISSDLVGAKIKPFRYDVSFRHTSNYAASICDDNGVYYDTNKKHKIVAHPLFPVRISWKIIENINQYWEIDFPEKALENLVHQSEYLEIHRLFKPGDELSVQGELAALVPHKLGAKITLKFDYFDSVNEHVQTEIVGGLLFGVKCTDYGKSSVELPNIERIEDTSPIWEEQIQIPRFAPFIYDGCNDIIYPIHTDRQFAQKMGLPDIILQGTATLAKSVSVMIKKELKNDPQLVQVISGKFTDIVVPPNQLSVLLQRRTETELYFNVMDKSGKFVLKGGYIKFNKV